MTRFKLIIEYDGTPFVGWQVQNNGVSVQGQLQKAILAMTGEEPQPNGAGRTDAGVHARGQVAHIDLDERWTPQKLREGINYHLKPDPIAIIDVSVVDDGFDARFSAVRRHYRYKIIDRRSPLTIDKMRAMHVRYKLDEDAMQEAASLLVGCHDFTTFRSVHCQAKSPQKSIDTALITREGSEVFFDCSARSFMHNQVRSLAGSLVLVGRSKWSVDDFKSALEACDRARCGTVAPAHGLYFMRVDYA